MSLVGLSASNSITGERTFMKLHVEEFYKKYIDIFPFKLNSGSNNGQLI
jgi:hypothetical protein